MAEQSSHLNSDLASMPNGSAVLGSGPQAIINSPSNSILRVILTLGQYKRLPQRRNTGIVPFINFFLLPADGSAYVTATATTISRGVIGTAKAVSRPMILWMPVPIGKYRIQVFNQLNVPFPPSDNSLTWIFTGLKVGDWSENPPVLGAGAP